MSKYLKLFETTSEYEAYINGRGVVLPNVSVAKDAPKTVFFNPIPPMNIITYEATAKLAETTTSYLPGIHTNAFSGKNGQLTITSHTFENGVGTIKFDGDVTSIGDSAFFNCSGMTSINIPSSVTIIGDDAFCNCLKLTSIIISDSVTSIGNDAFNTCIGLTSVTIGSGVTSIGNRAFGDCTSLTSITSNAMTAPTIESYTFNSVKTGGTLTVPSGSSGYDVWMGADNYYLGSQGWTKVEQ